MRILKSPFFYFAIFIVFCTIMAVNQSIEEPKEYYTVVNITYQDSTKDVYKQDGRPNVKLNEGELSINGTVIKSYVKSFEWNVYKK